MKTSILIAQSYPSKHGKVNGLNQQIKPATRSPSPPETVLTDEPFTTIRTISNGYQRQKSQSVKLIRRDEVEKNAKKAVRFADDFGLDLSEVKLIKSDELPAVPLKAFENLHLQTQRTKTLIYLQAQFENPLHQPSFREQLVRSNILLEQANAIANRIFGTIKLISFGLEKEVKIRLTTNHWMSYRDYDAHYLINSHDGQTDRFTFTIDVDSREMFDGNDVEFCLCYRTSNGREFWDNNFSKNYRFQCYERSVPDYSP